MPRIARIVAAGHPHHIFQRGNNRSPVFHDDTDRRVYLELLSRYMEEHGLGLSAYCLMDDHLHLLVVPGDEPSLSRGIGLTNQVYTQTFNRRHGSCGRVWQNRFFSCAVDGQHYLWSVIRFIINNPVRSGRVKRAEDYPWSSARAHLLQEDDALLAPSARLQYGDMEGFAAFARESNSYIEQRIRKATSCGRPFGSDAFVSELERRLQVRIKANPVGRPRKTRETR